MRTLFVTSTPWDRWFGTTIREALFIDALRERSEAVVCWIGSLGEGANPTSPDLLREVHANTVAVGTRLPAAGKRLRRLVTGTPTLLAARELTEGGPKMLTSLGHFDVIWCQRPLAFDLMSPVFGAARCAVDVDDVFDDYIRVKRATGQLDRCGVRESVALRWRSATWHRWYRQVTPGAVVVTSRRDAERIPWRAPAVVAPSGVPDRRPIGPGDTCTLAIVGSYGYAPNAQGARWFVERVWPTVRSAMPGSELLLVGHGSDAMAAGLRAPGVHGLGKVDDVGNAVAGCRALIAPILVGAGTRVKIAEALCLGKPLITTRAGCEGIELEDGVDAVIRDEPAEFAQACIDVLTDPVLAASLAERGRARYERDLSLAAVQRAVDHVIAVVRDRSANPPQR